MAILCACNTCACSCSGCSPAARHHLSTPDSAVRLFVALPRLRVPPPGRRIPRRLPGLAPADRHLRSASINTTAKSPISARPRSTPNWPGSNPLTSAWPTSTPSPTEPRRPSTITASCAAPIQREIFGFEQMQIYSQNPMTYAGGAGCEHLHQAQLRPAGRARPLHHRHPQPGPASHRRRPRQPRRVPAAPAGRNRHRRGRWRARISWAKTWSRRSRT